MTPVFFTGVYPCCQCAPTIDLGAFLKIRKQWRIGIYAFRTEVLRAVTALPQSKLELAESLEQLRWLENGYTIGVGITEMETIGIDTPEDLARAEAFLKQFNESETQRGN